MNKIVKFSITLQDGVMIQWTNNKQTKDILKELDLDKLLKFEVYTQDGIHYVWSYQNSQDKLVSML